VRLLAGAVWSMSDDFGNNDRLFCSIDMHVDAYQRAVLSSAQMCADMDLLVLMQSGVPLAMSMVRVFRNARCKIEACAVT